MPSPPLPKPQLAADDERRHRFEAVYVANRGPILGYVLRRTRNTDDAADIIAETFLTAWRRLDELPPGPQARLWLYGVARRMLANHHRGERRRLALADRLRADLAAYQPPEYTGELRPITQAFRALPAADQELLALTAWEGLDHGQIATVLGCSRNAVRIRLHRARRRFAAELARVHVESAWATGSAVTGSAQSGLAQVRPAGRGAGRPGATASNGDLA